MNKTITREIPKTLLCLKYRTVWENGRIGARNIGRGEITKGLLSYQRCGNSVTNSMWSHQKILSSDSYRYFPKNALVWMWKMKWRVKVKRQRNSIKGWYPHPCNNCQEGTTTDTTSSPIPDIPLASVCACVRVCKRKESVKEWIIQIRKNEKNRV